MGKELKLLLVSDIHLGKLIEHRPGEEAGTLLEKLLHCSEIDVVIDLGDRVNNENHDADLIHLNKTESYLSRFKCPVYSILGNHDVHYLNKQENIKSTGMPAPYYSKEIAGYLFVFLDTADPVIGDCGGHVSETQLIWLKETLSENDMPKIIFGHHPILLQNQEGNPFFVPIRGQEYVANKEEVMDILKNGKNVRAYINGHVHWSYFEKKNDIAFISVASLTEAYPCFSDAPGRYSILKINGNERLDIASCSLNPSRTIGRIIL